MPANGIIYVVRSCWTESNTSLLNVDKKVNFLKTPLQWKRC